MTDATELHALTALEQAAAVRAGDVTPDDLVRHSLARVEALDPAHGAFVTRTPDAALAAAAALGGPADRGTTPLFGVPTAVKDLVDTAGVTTTYGSKAFADHVPAVDAHTVTRMREAGLVSIGKTNTPEFGCCCYTDNDLVGPARNPWDRTLSAG
ncbi:amidase, partial [Streptomyces sp. SID5785]|uniref:amidase family protein n=1 Tax=Streptomyces sp. SID5785 TaxID=2690309 RepID=UPI001360F3F7